MMRLLMIGPLKSYEGMPTIVHLDYSEMFRRIFVSFFALLPATLLVSLPLSDTWWLSLHL